MHIDILLANIIILMYLVYLSIRSGGAIVWNSILKLDINSDTSEAVLVRIIKKFMTKGEWNIRCMSTHQMQLICGWQQCSQLVGDWRCVSSLNRKLAQDRLSHNWMSEIVGFLGGAVHSVLWHACIGPLITLSIFTWFAEYYNLVQQMKSFCCKTPPDNKIVVCMVPTLNNII